MSLFWQLQRHFSGSKISTVKNTVLRRNVRCARPEIVISFLRLKYSLNHVAEFRLRQYFSNLLQFVSQFSFITITVATLTKNKKSTTIMMNIRTTAAIISLFVSITMAAPAKKGMGMSPPVAPPKPAPVSAPAAPKAPPAPAPKTMKKKGMGMTPPIAPPKAPPVAPSAPKAPPTAPTAPKAPPAPAPKSKKMSKKAPPVAPPKAAPSAPAAPKAPPAPAPKGMKMAPPKKKAVAKIMVVKKLAKMAKTAKTAKKAKMAMRQLRTTEDEIGEVVEEVQEDEVHDEEENSRDMSSFFFDLRFL
jgi:hypothetical protein